MDDFTFDLGRYPDKGRLVGPIGQPAVDGVVAQIGPASDEPARERRVGIVQHFRKRCFPMDAFSLAAPEFLGLFDGLPMKFTGFISDPDSTLAARSAQTSRLALIKWKKKNGRGSW